MSFGIRTNVASLSIATDMMQAAALRRETAAAENAMHVSLSLCAHVLFLAPDLPHA